jgi:HlyD family secretion protein
MECDQSAALVHELKTLFNVGVVRDLTDGQLLERFATDRGEAAELAFAVLLERHGPMVLRVCRSVLSDGLEVDDAFQATFLVLVRKARGLWVRDSLGPWLHQVAFRTASRARLAASRRRKHEEHVAATRPEAQTVKNNDLDGLLLAEIEKLPERFRAPVVLCDLEGCSHQQAARHLGWPVGTVKSRQARGREKLRDRLRRLGVVPNVALLGSGSRVTGVTPAIPPALVESTTRCVVQFVTCHSAIRASTLALVQEVLKSMSMTRWLKAASVLLVIGATVSGAGLFSHSRAPAAPPPARTDVESASTDEPITFRVKPGAFELTYVEPGLLESARNQDMFSNVKGTTTIIMIKPEGTAVKKGEIVCELDSAALKDQLVNAQIAIKHAEVDYQNARVARELAESAVAEFIDGTFKQELNSAKTDVALAESAIQQTERRRDRARKARARLADLLAAKNGVVAASDIVAELDIEDRLDASEQSLLREKAALDRAKSRQEILEEYTRDRTQKALALEVERARPEERAKHERWQLEQSKAKSLERQIAACKIMAPADGLLVYAKPPRLGPNRPRLPYIEEGAQVRERQKILSLPDLTRMQVVTKVNESQVAGIRRGTKATVRVHAFPERLFNGVVVDIAPLPDSLPSDSDARVYTTKLLINGAIPGLRPGMTTRVEFLIADRADALAVPHEAILNVEGKPHVAVRKPGANVDVRAVSLGLSNDKLVEITQGIESGDDVIVNPTAYLSGEPKSPVTQPSTSSGSSRTPPDRKP